MNTLIHSFSYTGINAEPVDIEVEITAGLGIHLVGLADASTKEALPRTVTALQANGYRIPGKKICIYLKPVNTPKRDTHYDLPLALAMVGASGQEDLPEADKYIVAGELGLDGSVRPVLGAMQAAELAKATNAKGVILPKQDAIAVEPFYGDALDVYGVSTLTDAVTILQGKPFPIIQEVIDTLPEKPIGEPKSAWSLLSMLPGRDAVMRALEIAAAGGHDLLFVGAPGTGKTTAAKAFLELLPPLSAEEAKENASLRSVSSAYINPYTYEESLKKRPFRAPHYSASIATIIGGGVGMNIRPGEVSLANKGVLFLDDVVLFPKSAVEAIRTSLEDKYVTMSRLHTKVTYPADYQLVAAMQPCPCGHYGEGDRCTCTAGQREAYLSRLNGPLYDHIDMQLYLNSINAVNTAPAESAEDVAKRVAAARAIQTERFKDEPFKLNARMRTAHLEKYCPLDEECRQLIESLIERLGLSARAFSRMLRIARTIADLEGSETIKPAHLAEASSFRFLDRNIHNILINEKTT